MGAKVVVEPEYGWVGQVVFKNGKKVLFRGTSFNINALGSVEISRDKGYSSFFLKRFGYPVPQGQTFFSDALNKHLKKKRTMSDGYAYCRTLGFPIFVKPNALSKGCLVCKVYNKREYDWAARHIFKRSSVMIVERFCRGRDYRVVVLQNKVISAYERKPLSVTGDGRATIRRLLIRKQRYFEKIGRDTRIDPSDRRIAIKLKHDKRSMRTVPRRGETVYLLDNANLSTGGDAIDVTDNIHPTFRRLAINVTKDMALRLCGVDIITADITQRLSDYVILEINGAPGLDNYAMIGPKQSKIVEDLYLKVLSVLEKS
jgi:D-alanine-D-alanine ligase-like ATP-grasp enzyme